MKHSLRAPIFIGLFYLCVAKLAHTLLVTSVTSYVLMTSKISGDLPNTVNEISSQYVFFAYALGALLVALTLWFGNRALYRNSEFWNEGKKKGWELSREIKANLRRGAASAFLLVVLLVGLFFFSGQLSFLGLFITSTIGTAVFPLFVLDFASLMVMVVCEEYIFRYRLLARLAHIFSPVTAICVSATLYTLIKWLQFDLTGTDIFNLMMLNAALGFLFLRTGRVHRGLGFLTVFYGMLHPLGGLPLWGQSGPSIFLFKHNAQNTGPWLTGADAGPLAGLGMSSLLFLLLLGAIWSWRSERS